MNCHLYQQKLNYQKEYNKNKNHKKAQHKEWYETASFLRADKRDRCG